MDSPVASPPPAPISDAQAAAWALAAYPLLKMLSAPPAVAAELARKFNFEAADRSLPRIDAPPASGHVFLSAVVTALERLEQRQYPETLRCALIAADTLVELCDTGRMAEAVAALKIGFETLRTRLGWLNLTSMLGTLAGAFAFAEKSELPMFAHTERVMMSAQTGGAYSELVHELVKASRPWHLPEDRRGLLSMEEDARLAQAMETLRTDGYLMFDRRLPQPVVEELVRFSADAPAEAVPVSAGNGAGRVDLSNKEADGYQIDQQAALDHPMIQEIIADSSLLAVVGQYFGCIPVLGMVVMRWSFSSERAPNDDLAQLYHWDDDWVRWLKFFIYLTDVDETCGPHVYVRGSHRPGSKPQSLLSRGYSRIPDADIEAVYPAADIISAEAPSGSILAGDTRCWHKGLQPTGGRRLLLQLNFADTLSMGPPPPAGPLFVKRSHTERFRRFVAANREIFPTPYFIIEDGALEGL
jgi:hypothetical protein